MWSFFLGAARLFLQTPMNTAGTANSIDKSPLAAVIELWQLLRTNAPREMLLPRLSAAAEFSLHFRFPLFGVLPSACEHADPEIRSAALRLLAGATGPVAWKRIVAGLDDSEPIVRIAAVQALHISAEEAPPRLVHGLFHPDPKVRHALCLLPWLEAGRPFYLHLLADEACREIVIARISGATIDQETLQRAAALFADGHLDEAPFFRLMQSRFRDQGYSESLMGLLREAIRDRVLEREQLVAIASSELPALQLLRTVRPLCEVGTLPKLWESRALSQLQLDEVFLLACNGPARPLLEVQHILQSARSGRGLAVLHKVPSADVLDDLLDHFWLPQPDGLRTTPRWFDAGRFSQQRLRWQPDRWSFLDGLKDFPQRLAAAIFWAAHRHGLWHPDATVLCARIEPRLLIMSAVPVDVRQQAIESILQSTDDGSDFAPPELVKSLIRREARLLVGLDLRLVAAFSRLLPDQRIQTVVDLVGFPDLVEPAREDPAAVLPLFQCSDDALIGSQLLAAIADRGKSYVTIATELAVSLNPDEWLKLVDLLSHQARVQIAIEITRRECQEESPHRQTNLQRLGELLGGKIASVTLAQDCLRKEWPHELGRDMPFAASLWSQNNLTVQPEVESLAADSGNLQPVPSTPDPLVVTFPAPRQILEVQAAQQQIAAATDLDELAAWCADHSSELAEDAALRLVELGGAAIARLAEMIRAQPAVRWVKYFAWTVSLWPAEAARDWGLPIFADESLPAELRYVIGLGLLEHGCDVFDQMAEIATTDCNEPWLTSDLWDRLQQYGREALARHMVWSAQPIFVPWAIFVLENVDEQDVHPGIFDELLRRDPERIPFQTAVMLWSNRRTNRPETLPLLMFYLIDLARDWGQGHLSGLANKLFAQADSGQLDEFVTATLTVGSKMFEDFKLLILVENCNVRTSKIDALRRVILEATDTETRENAANQLQQIGFVSPKFARVVQSFVWGIRKSRLLLNREFRVRMLGTGDLGYTQLEQPVIYVSAIPLLAGHRNGKDIVEGLILHELGHHIYHATDEHLRTGEIARDEKLFSLLNIVNDEHLERNLRGNNREYGDRLKKLGAYAFQHLERELPVELLLARLGHRAFRVLTRCRLKPARQAGHVVLSSGEVLMELERAGASFPRFLRGLRMGLGNRHDDPKVAEALALFGKPFRNSTADEQLSLARKLREIFREESDLLDAFENSSAFPPLESQLRARAEGLDDAALQAAVAEALAEGEKPKPRQPIRGDDDDGLQQPGGINRSTDETFSPLTNVITVPHDPAAHAAYANRVVEQARRLREYLKDLGRDYRSDRFRISGARFDSSRAAALVLRNDPRVMTSRKLKRANDLFLSVLVDCSGSMEGERLEHAKLFATLVSEATRGLSGIDLRHFGFTHDTIFEAGDAVRCGVHGLCSTGGNNDAGALWHAAKAGFRSQRRAKVLIMISDGTPTACSAGALRNLVHKLSHQHRMVCAQVAVAPLTEVCFPYYVSLDPGNWRESVRRFGTIIASLVTKALG